MRRIVFVVLSFMLVNCVLSGQNNAQHSMYMLDIYKHNPAYAGFDRSLSLNFNYRNQWEGIPQNPKQFYVNGHLPIYLLKGAAGFSIENDSRGVLNSTNFTFSFNRVRSFAGGIVSLGIRLGIQQLSLNGSEIRTPEGIYQGGFSHEDLLLGINTINGLSPTWSVGLYTSTDFFDFGFTLKDIFASSTQLDQINFENSKRIDVYGAMPFLINDLEIQASFYIKSNLQQIQSDISALVKSGNIFGGLSLRGFNESTLDALVILGGIQLNKHYSLYYSYDMGLSRLSQVSQGSHEIHINYNLNKLIGIGLPPEIIYNPRNL